jgi:hypothetical protein
MDIEVLLIPVVDCEFRNSIPQDSSDVDDIQFIAINSVVIALAVWVLNIIIAFLLLIINVYYERPYF